jgi:hypothetical protein
MKIAAHSWENIWLQIKMFFAPVKTNRPGAPKKRKLRARKTTTFFEMP